MVRARIRTLLFIRTVLFWLRVAVFVGATVAAVVAAGDGARRTTASEQEERSTHGASLTQRPTLRGDGRWRTIVRTLLCTCGRLFTAHVMGVVWHARRRQATWQSGQCGGFEHRSRQGRRFKSCSRLPFSPLAPSAQWLQWPQWLGATMTTWQSGNAADLNSAPFRGRRFESCSRLLLPAAALHSLRQQSFPAWPPRALCDGS